MPWHCKDDSADRDRCTDWFSTRRDYFIRQVMGEALSLVFWFQHVYVLYRDGFLHGNLKYNDGITGTSGPMHIELLRQFTVTVGTENDKGPLWQLKDLCHQVWPRKDQNQSLQGIIFDWLIGSLFHECVKLKENLYLLSHYGGKEALLAPLSHSFKGAPSPSFGEDPLEKTRVLMGQGMGEIARQMERVGFLFGQVSYLLRRIVPDLIENRLVIRLLAEQERLIRDLWGESLEELLAAACNGSEASGLCAAAEAYFRGQWYRQSLGLYKRALAYDRHCQEALIRTMQITTLLERDQGSADH